MPINCPSTVTGAPSLPAFHERPSTVDGSTPGSPMHSVPRVKAAELADREVAAGRPIVVLAWQVQVTRYAHRLAAAPSWLTTPATATVRVFADDTCEPASL
jgi:hypothetical protein